MARLYANENFPLPAVEELRRLGHDVLTIQEAGKADQSTPDEEVLAFSKADDRILLTLNRKHFIRLHREQPDHTGIIWLPHAITVAVGGLLFVLGILGRLDMPL